MSFDYIIVGGGIIGMMTARELATRGAKVAIFDRNKLGMESSWAAGGILSAMRPWSEPAASVILSEQGKKLYPEYVKALQQETGIDSEYIRSGLVIIDRDHAASTKAWASSVNIKIEGIENLYCNVNLPNYSVLLPEIAQVRPNRLLKALYKSLQNLSVSIYENTEISRLEITNGQFQFVEFDGGKLVADAVIVTAGAWSNSLLGNELNIRPIRGQMVCVKTEEKLFDNVILDGPHYLMPRRDGHILIGSTMEDVGFINETTKEAREELLDWAYSVCPALKSAKPVSQWSGLRPSAAANIPIIGQLPEYENIYINAGHFRKGIIQAPSSAKLLVDTLLGKDSFMDINRFSLDCQKEPSKIA